MLALVLEVQTLRDVLWHLQGHLGVGEDLLQIHFIFFIVDEGPGHIDWLLSSQRVS